MTSTRRISPAWLAAAGVVFAADILLHLPVTDICDDLVKRFGFFTFDGFVRRGFILFGFAFLCGAWVAPRRQRVPVGAATVVLIAVAVAAQLLIVLNAERTKKLFRLPSLDWAAFWEVLVDTVESEQYPTPLYAGAASAEIELEALSVVVLRSIPPPR